MGTGTCSPDLDFPSVTVVRSPESVRIGRGDEKVGSAEAERHWQRIQCSAGHIFLLPFSAEETARLGV